MPANAGRTNAVTGLRPPRRGFRPLPMLPAKAQNRRRMLKIFLDQAFPGQPATARRPGADRSLRAKKRAPA